MIAKASAFFGRDLRIAASYRITFVQSLVGIVLGLTTMNFVAELVNQGEPADLEAYGSDYFGYVLVGVTFALFMQSASGQFAGAVRTAQMTGTLEVLLGSRTSLTGFLFCSSLYGLAFALVRLVLALVVGAVVLGANLRIDGAAIATVVLLLTLATFAGIGILAAAFVVRFKQPEPLTAGITTASLLLSGVLYPTTVLPGWLEHIASFIPLTYTMSALRGGLLEGASSGSLGSDLLALAGFATILPISLVIFRLAVERAKTAGSLAHY